MRYTLIVILILIGTSSISQVTFISIPLDKQLIGRDPITNLGNIAIIVFDNFNRLESNDYY